MHSPFYYVWKNFFGEKLSHRTSIINELTGFIYLKVILQLFSTDYPNNLIDQPSNYP